MNKTLKWVLGLLAAAVLFVGIYAAYNSLSKAYKPGGLMTNTQASIATIKTENTAPRETASAATGTQESTASETTAAPEKEPYHSPDFTVVDSRGNAVKLSDMAGKPVIVNFWASWCYFCKQEMPDFEAAYRQYGDDIAFLMVNATDGMRETVDVAKAFVAGKGYTFPLYFDTAREAVAIYHVTGFPATYFFDAKGNLVTQASGALDAATLARGIAMLVP